MDVPVRNKGFQLFINLFENVDHALIYLTKNATFQQGYALRELAGTLRLWRDGLWLDGLEAVFCSSHDLTVAILSNICSIGYIVLKLPSHIDVMAKLDRQLDKLSSTLRHTATYLGEIQPNEAEYGEDESDGATSDISDDEVETYFDSLKLRARLLMKLVPTMEKVIASSGFSQQVVKTDQSKASVLEQQRQNLDPPNYDTTIRSVSESRTTKQGLQPSRDRQTFIGDKSPADITHSGSTPPEMSLNRSELEFRNLLLRLSVTPMKWENPGLLDEALKNVPLDRLYTQAENEYNELTAIAASLNEELKPAWGYQDAVIRSLLRWFKREFFEFVNNPICSYCRRSTIPVGQVPPTHDEEARSAARVELYRCTAGGCQTYTRFPRYSDVWVLMETRKGRAGEFVNCFGMLCRALGARVRWVWNSEDAVWIEVYSDHRRRWIHVDPCEELWDSPRIYTEGWGRTFGYCVAFSKDGATDVTRRYVRKSKYLRKRTRASEPALRRIIAEIKKVRHEPLSKTDRMRLFREDEKEERELTGYVAQDEIAALLQSLSLELSTEIADTQSSKPQIQVTDEKSAEKFDDQGGGPKIHVADEKRWESTFAAEKDSTLSGRLRQRERSRGSPGT